MSLLSLLRVIAAQGSAAPIDVFIWAGQSNAQGFTGSKAIAGGTVSYLGTGTSSTNTTLPAGRDEEIPPVPANIGYFFDGTVAQEISTYAVTETTAGNGVNGYYWGYRAGPVPAFIKKYHELTGRKVLVVYHAFGGSGVVSGVTYSGGNWATTYRGTMLTKWGAFKTAAATANLSYRFQGIVWCQGTDDIEAMKVSKITESQYRSSLSALFDGFYSDYSSDYIQTDSMIKTYLCGLYGGDMANSSTQDKLFPDDYWYALGRKVQRDIADSNAHSRLAYGALESFYSVRSWGNGRPTGYTGGNSVHWNQSQYNDVGEGLANEISSPNSTYLQPNPPTGLTATADGCYRVKLAWIAPATRLGLVQRFNIYHRVSGATDWTWVWRYWNLSVPVTQDFGPRYQELTAFWDETNLAPNTTYEFRVGYENEFGEAYSELANATTASLATDTLTTYNTLCSPSNTALLANIYSDVGAAGLLPNMRQLIIARSDTQAAAAGHVYNLIRAADSGNDRFDWVESGATRRALALSVADGQYFATSGSNGLYPQNGPWSICLAFNLTARTGPSLATRLITAASSTSFESGAPIIGVRNDGSACGIDIGSDKLISNNFHFPSLVKSAAITEGAWRIDAWVYDGRILQYYTGGSSTPYSKTSTSLNGRWFFPMPPCKVYLWSMNQVNIPTNYTGATLSIAACAGANRAWSGAEYASLYSILNTRLGLGL